MFSPKLRLYFTTNFADFNLFCEISNETLTFFSLPHKLVTIRSFFAYFRLSYMIYFTCFIENSRNMISSSRTHVRLGAWFWSAQADIFFSESLHILAEHLSQSEIELPLRNTCYYSPLAEVGVSTQTEINKNSHNNYHSKIHIFRPVETPLKC